MSIHARGSVLCLSYCVIPLGGFAVAVLFFSSTMVHAFTTGTAIATTFPVEGVVAEGDVVSYDPERRRYVRSNEVHDKNIFGVVALDPALLITDNVVEDDMVPLLRFGEARVRVSAEAGEVRPGDYLTSSNVPGVAVRADTSVPGFVLGIALDAYPGVGLVEEFVLHNGSNVSIGRIPVSLRIGAYTPEMDVATGTNTLLAGTGDMEKSVPVVPEGKSILDLLRYLIAAAVALGALFVALRNFGGSLSESIASVGRNPLAKTYILSMMFWNSMLIILICMVGFGIGAFIIMYPQ